MNDLIVQNFGTYVWIGAATPEGRKFVDSITRGEGAPGKAIASGALVAQVNVRAVALLASLSGLGAVELKAKGDMA